MTPLAALAPYMAAAASFNILTLSMSEDDKYLKSSIVLGTPLITTRGLLSLSDELPRIKMFTDSSPGAPPLSVIIRPGILPCNACCMFEVGACSNTLPVVVPTAPVKDPLVLCP